MRAALILTGLVLAATVAAPARADIVDLIDKPAPELSCTQWWNGGAKKMAALRGRLLVVHFSNPEKITSIAFVESVRKLHKLGAERPIEVVEIVLAKDPKVVTEYFSKFDVKWRVGLDAKGDAARAFAGSSVPRTYLIGPDGSVAHHAHVNTITEAVLAPQFARVPFFVEKGVPRKAKALAKAMAKQKFAKALELARKLLEDKYAGEEETRLAGVAKAEVERSFKLRMKLLKRTIKDVDWALAWRRVELIKKLYKGTPHQVEADAAWTELSNNPRVPYHTAALEWIERIVTKTNLRRKKELESAIAELLQVQKKYENALAAKKAKEWEVEFRRILREGFD